MNRVPGRVGGAVMLSCTPGWDTLRLAFQPIHDLTTGGVAALEIPAQAPQHAASGAGPGGAQRR
ncbi:hypothetical protein [Streptomyces sp. NBC_01314]|uniref:hypothetical protein n=1 Tax=Streptomyces sp. NBC_01314 TaxID=2903821 RepID=UPI003093CE7F|nr:EAL domain-containing protein [Streptomyces sp. NBC_01314]